MLNLPSRGAPGNRRDSAASRGDCPNSGESLTALVPETGFGLTHKLYPDFLFYIPYASEKIFAQFSLVDGAGNIIDRQTIDLPDTAGIIRVRVGGDKGLKEVDKIYLWRFQIVCGPAGTPLRQVRGGIQRVQLKLENIPPEQRLEIYYNNGLWFDYLTQLTFLKLQQPDNTSLSEQWRDLLKVVGLENIDDKKLLTCCDRDTVR
ncbi:MAG: DUF928 domain-containing protein [Chlorogloea purpurea SAG 13.99]|nr:DUF928 domain-containing protein [Chlorogloea purpurea SAG 13.99]